MTLKGKAYCFGDHINTDLIIAGRYCHLPAEEMARHVMEDEDATFVDRFEKGGIIVGQRNFGCGSSREEAPSTLKAAGISCVIARSFARIFYRNCVNIGLPILECPQACQAVEEGHELSIDTTKGTIKDETTGALFQAAPFPEFMRNLIDGGGLMADARRRLAAKS